MRIPVEGRRKEYAEVPQMGRGGDLVVSQKRKGEGGRLDAVPPGLGVGTTKKHHLSFVGVYVKAE